MMMTLGHSKTPTSQKLRRTTSHRTSPKNFRSRHHHQVALVHHHYSMMDLAIPHQHRPRDSVLATPQATTTILVNSKV